MIRGLLRKMDEMEEEMDKIMVEMLKEIELKTKEIKKLKEIELKTKEIKKRF